ncbi:MAG: hypothetical protein L0Z62_45375 [Gemmataceae bacterium]|nr:hypothetical protein [Gemmataceae bacterium]
MPASRRQEGLERPVRPGAERARPVGPRRQLDILRPEVDGRISDGLAARLLDDLAAHRHAAQQLDLDLLANDRPGQPGNRLRSGQVRFAWAGNDVEVVARGLVERQPEAPLLVRLDLQSPQHVRALVDPRAHDV